MIDPSASVAKPGSPCPIMQPKAVMPPRPASIAPTMWRLRSATF